MVSLLEQQTVINNKLSQRFIALDPGGYFIIYNDSDSALIYAKHFTNAINDKGLAVDPETNANLRLLLWQKLPKNFVFKFLKYRKRPL
jgi:Domain of unknown function (DUF4346)